MSEKVYSRMGDIPGGSAGDALTEGCLVLEGGAFRGLYTQGFLDALMVNGINISCVVGVSAGALGGMNYVSGQIGRSARINLGYRHDSRYVGAKALLRGHSFLDVGFLTEDRGILEPFDRERFFRPERRFAAVVTNCLTGEAEFFEKGKCGDIILAVRASATMPFISPMVEMDGTPYLDGGCSCPIPCRWALDQGYGKVLLIRTRDISFRQKEKEIRAAYAVYRRYPALAERLARNRADYNRACDEAEALHAEGKILRFAPSEPVSVSRIEGDLEKLGDLYWLGWKDCEAGLGQIREYLEN